MLIRSSLSFGNNVLLPEYNRRTESPEKGNSKVKYSSVMSIICVDLHINEPFSMKSMVNASPKIIDPGQPVLSV